MGSEGCAVAGIEKAVERSIEEMKRRLSESLSIDDMARVAMYSKFHFSREFHRITGISPRRFLSALRIQEAKRLLLTTSMTVTEISCTVGYSSVGTFSSRFASSVGLSPSVYRRVGGFVRRVDAAKKGETGGAVCGSVGAPVASYPGLIFLGLFPTRIPEGKPVSCAVLTCPGPFELRDVPVGTWYLLGHSVPAVAHEALTDSSQAVHVGSVGPLEIAPRAARVPVDFRLRGASPLDPPVLLALQRVRSAAFEEGLVPAVR
ncbi:helix-turn-helix transcriptional regulator [Streptomyces sp. NPDC050842]|uniref:helix-turn-helix transcriptional regulator n=1 Tax=Streptomyces sp. NPDC050842 TaxID=3365636 RepID=UPI0037A0DF65